MKCKDINLQILRSLSRTSSPVRPKEHGLSGLAAFRHVDNPLVRRAAEIQSRILQGVDEGAVDEDVAGLQQGFAGRLSQDFFVQKPEYTQMLFSGAARRTACTSSSRSSAFSIGSPPSRVSPLFVSSCR